MLLRRICLSSFGLLLFACTQGGGSPNPLSDLKVVGGAPSSQGAWPSAVALLINSGGGQSLCSGTLVAPQLVVTAAHCMVDVQPGDKVRVILGNALRGGQTVDVVKTGFNPQYPNSSDGDINNVLFDAAYAVLAQPLTNVPLVPVLSDKDESKTLLAVGAASTLVGFGETTEGDHSSTGTKFETTTVVGRPDRGALFIGGGGKDTCQGDSGGPAFGQLPNGQWRVYAITSRGSGCSGGGDYARISDSLCWLQTDSGQLIPSSTASCPGLPAPTPTAAAGLFLALGGQSPTEPDAFLLGASAPQGTARVSLCFGTAATCTASPLEAVGFQKNARGTATADLFTSTQLLHLTAGGTVTLLAFDASGRQTAVQTVVFNPGSGP